VSTLVRCEICSKPIRIKEEFAGKRVKCPACGEVFRAPDAAPTATPIAAAGDDPNRAAPAIPLRHASKHAPPHRSRRLWPWLVGGAGVLCLLVVGVVYLLWRSPAEDDSNTGPLRVTKVIRARVGLLGDGRRLNVNFPDQDVVVVLKVNGFPGVHGSVFDWSRKSYIQVGKERREFNYMSGVEGDSPLWLGAVIPRNAQTLTLHLDGLQPLTVALPETIEDTAKMYK
jgi:phage FluMu protein Com